jgi:hypothetical protein
MGESIFLIDNLPANHIQLCEVRSPTGGCRDRGLIWPKFLYIAPPYELRQSRVLAGDALYPTEPLSGRCSSFFAERSVSHEPPNS